MADVYDNSNSGVVYFNTEKTNEKAPDYELSFNWAGQDYRIAAWKRVTKQGKKMISFKIEDGPKPSGKSGKASGGDGW
jgi:uncharacterized protein (DUF736 family)